jgi:hypothetical protein
MCRHQIKILDKYFIKAFQALNYFGPNTLCHSRKYTFLQIMNTINQFQQRAFSTATLADYGNILPFLDIEIYVLKLFFRYNQCDVLNLKHFMVLKF